MTDDPPDSDDGRDDLDRLARAARTVAASNTDVDPDIVTDAIRYAREEAETGRTRYRILLADVAGSAVAGLDPEDPDPNSGPNSVDAERRAVAYARLRQHVERRRSRESDVDGLFE